tara:strand:- start:293 stop:805 length:513 start_codon:yes stop_codon:yes gene_type:complete
MLGLPYPGGPHVAQLALDGITGIFEFPRPMVNRPGLDFSFSGLKTAVKNTIAELSIVNELDSQARANIARGFEDAVVSTLAIKCRRALQQTGLKRLIIAGGVSANLNLRQVLESTVSEVDGSLYYAQPKYCTDNGAMIAYAGCQRLSAGETSDLNIDVKPRWSLETLDPL